MATNRKSLALTLPILLGCLLPLAAAQDVPDTQVVEMTLSESNSSDLGFLPRRRLAPLLAPRETLESEPKYKSRGRIYYGVVYGDSTDNVFTLVIDESGGPGKGFDTLYVDANNDNRIDPEKERFSFRMSQKDSAVDEEPLRVTIEVSSGGRKYPYRVAFRASPDSNAQNPAKTIRAQLFDPSYCEGEAFFGGKSRKIAIADLNGNGLFSDVPAENLMYGDRFFADLDGDGGFRSDIGVESQPGYPYGGYTKIAGRWYTVVADPDGRQIRISAASPALGLVQAGPSIASVHLVSKTQQCQLDFSNGLAEAVAGTYQLEAIDLKATSDSGKVWRTGAFVAGDTRPEVVVRENETVELSGGGPPLRIEPTISRGADAGELKIGLAIFGTAGEEYYWYESNPSVVKPSVEICDESRPLLPSVSFKFGRGEPQTHVWRVPGNLTGVLRITPKLDTGPFESELVSREIEVKDGRWVEEPK